MRKLLPFVVLIAVIVVAFLDAAYSQSPWVVNFNATHPVPVTNSSELASKIASAVPGDWIQVADGSYTGNLSLNNAGTATAGILIECAGHCTLSGNFKMNAEYNYVKGFDISGGSGTSGIDLFCKNCGAINNSVHGVNGAVGIGAWNTGPGQIIYGNIVYTQVPNANNPHNIYTQNDFGKNGYKYFVENYVSDPAQTGNTFNFHAYAQGNYISGYWLERNVFANGEVLVGSKSTIQPDHDQVFKSNYTYSADLRPCYARPTTFNGSGNYLGKSRLRAECVWGTPESVYPELAGPSIFTGNTIINPTTQTMYTYSYKDPCQAGKDPGCPRVNGVNLRPDNNFDNNRYVPQFIADFWAGGVHQGVTDLPTWRSLTAAAGKEFDTNSVVEASEPTKQFFLENEYDPLRGMLIVYNWEGLPSITFTKSGSFAIYKIKDSWGTPVVSGSGSAVVPLTGEFEAFIVKSAPAPACDMQAIESKRLQALAVLNSDLPQTKKIKQTRIILNEMGIETAKCLQ